MKDSKKKFWGKVSNIIELNAGRKVSLSVTINWNLFHVLFTTQWAELSEMFWKKARKNVKLIPNLSKYS